MCPSLHLQKKQPFCYSVTGQFAPSRCTRLTHYNNNIQIKYSKETCTCKKWICTACLKLQPITLFITFFLLKKQIKTLRFLVLFPDTELLVLSSLTPYTFYHFYSPSSFFYILSANKTSSLGINLCSFFLLSFSLPPFFPFFSFFFFFSFLLFTDVKNYLDKISQALTGKFFVNKMEGKTPGKERAKHPLMNFRINTCCDKLFLLLGEIRPCLSPL